jgi:hypothetical protein
MLLAGEHADLDSAGLDECDVGDPAQHREPAKLPRGGVVHDDVQCRIRPRLAHLVRHGARL